MVHQGSGQEFSTRCSGTAAAECRTTWNIPPAAKLGVYKVSLERPEAPMQAAPAASEGEGEARQRSLASGKFRVEEFRLPLVDARLSGPKAVQVAPASVAVNVQMSYFSGGPMGGARFAPRRC